MYGFEPNAWGVTAIWIPANNCTIKGMGNVQLRGYAVEIAGNGNRVIGSTIHGPIHAGVLITGGWEGPVTSNNVVGGTEPGEGNVISSIRIDGPAADNLVVGNIVTDGIDIRAGATGNRIGGTTPAERNVISGAGSFSGEGCPLGEQISVENSDGNVIEGNYIGTTPDGLASGGQLGTEGIEIRDSSNTIVRNNLIGGILVVGSNHCNGDRFGTAILLHGASSGTLIQGNSIGTDINGIGPITNRAGISIQNWQNNTPSGTLIASNLIDFSETNGVTVGPGVVGVTLSGNEIFDNGGAGIDLVLDGNDGQAAPALDVTSVDGAGVRIVGSLTSNPGNTFGIEFFYSPACDPSGFGEGAVYLGATTVVTNAGGVADFDLVLPVAVPEGQVITATATEQVTGNTSEFSECSTVLAVGQCTAAPSEVWNVFMDSNRTTVSWASMGEGTTYDVARGDVVWLGSNKPAECLTTGSSETSFDDTQTPDPGNGYYYLVRANNACGTGPWGTDSMDQPRTTICP